MKYFFDMSDLGLLKSYLGIQVNQLEEEIRLAQSSYALKILSDFNLLECNSSQTPLEVRAVLNQDDFNNLVDSTTYRSLMGSNKAFYAVVKTHKRQSNKIYNSKLTMTKM